MRMEAVLLDMGGVLLDMGGSNGVPNGQLDFRGRQAMLRVAGALHSGGLRRGTGVTAEDLESIVFEPWHREYGERYRRGHEADLMPRLTELRLSTGSSATESELLEAWFEPFGQSLCSVEGAVEAVRAVRGLGLAVGLVSNVPLPGALYRAVLEREGFDGFIDAYRFSYDTGHRKPSPAMLRSALAELGAPAGSAVMVGDRRESDVAAGRVAGVGTVWIQSDHVHGPEPDWTLPSITMLPELLERLLAPG